MDSKPESAATTLMRIEVLVLQGICRAAFLFLLAAVLTPLLPFVETASRFRLYKGEFGFWKRLALCPKWFLYGVLLAALNPFAATYKVLSYTAAMVRVEWRERWRNGTAKYPDGTPMVIPGIHDELELDVAVTKGVISDYNKEALEHGQGFPDFTD